MSFYDEAVSLAVEMLAEFGGPATLVSSTTTFNKQTGRTTASNSTSTPVTTVIAPEEVDDVDGRKVTRAVATLTVKPTEGDKLVVGSQTYMVGNVTIIPVQNQPAIYKAEVS